MSFISLWSENIIKSFKKLLWQNSFKDNPVGMKILV